MSVSMDSSQLAHRIEAIGSDGCDHVALEDIAEVVQRLMASVEGDLSSSDLKIQGELNGLIQFIAKVKLEVVQLDPNSISDDHITPATDELNAVVAATESATGVFLDAAESLETVADETEDSALAETLRGVATNIYEASNFQDITGQRINKVVGALRHIETKIAGLAALLDDRYRDFEPTGEVPAATAQDATGAEAPDDLLHGPSLPDAANSQADIDALLASFD